MPTPQAPIGSGFGAASTAAEVIAGCDLTGTTAVITGGYSGRAQSTPSRNSSLEITKNFTSWSTMQG